MAHVGHCQVRPDYYPIAFLFFSISYSSGHFQLHSYEIICHGRLPKKKNSQIINAACDIHHFHFSVTGDLGLDICKKVSAGFQEKQDERTEVLCISTQHQLQHWRLSTLYPRASALSTSQEEPVVHGS